MHDFWADPRSLVATEGISVDFFSSGYLDISVPRVRFATLCIHAAILLAEWVSPFGHLRIDVCCRLPGAFRRLPRPSSPLTAKASTVCAYSLDHITPSRLRVLVQHFAYLPQRHVWFDRTKTLVTSQVFKEHEPDFSVQSYQFVSVRLSSTRIRLSLRCASI